jgi:hypothetical protein
LVDARTPPDFATGGDRNRTEENEARLEAARAALAWLDDHSGAEGADDATESLRALYEARVRRLQIIPRAIRDGGTSRRWSGI